MAESVVSSVGQTIGKLLIDEARFLWGVEDKVKDLQRELERIQAFLRDADARREHEHGVGVWVAQLRDIAYDAEDVIERYILKVAPKKGQNIIKACACFVAKCTCLQVHVVGTEIERLKSSISNLRTSMQAYGIRMANEGERQRTRASMPRRTYAHLEEDFVGREDSIKELVKELLKDGEHHRVIAICGMGGLGKTSLARKVFAHDEVKNHFDGFAWACISQEYQVKDVLMEILVKLIPDERERVMKMMVQELFEALYKIQQEKRCIVVLDDIWTKEAWDSLGAAFPIKKTKSKLLITTRNRDVAAHIDPRGFLHEPPCLSEKESWELLIKRAFPDIKGLTVEFSSIGPGVGQGAVTSQAIEGIKSQSETEEQIPEITENMKRLGQELLKKCGGLPLAVIVVGGLLAVNEWETVNRNINLHFSDESDVKKVLALSYDDLPWYLKPCFLYLGNFPEDAQIPAMKVIHMWIAEGFVPPDAHDEESEITMEDVAEQYLMELVKRGMVQARFTLSGKIRTCRLHDLMRDLCVSKARQERFLGILNIRQDDESRDCPSSMGIEDGSTCKTRRLSLNMCLTGEENTILGVEQIRRIMLHLRSLMVFISGLIFDWTLDTIFISCKFLRILKLEGIRGTRNLPESVGDLIHLRYLSLEGSSFWGLPQSLGNLVCMESLDLYLGTRCEITIPNVLWKMKRLRHLRLPIILDINDELSGNQKKLQLNPLKNLQTSRNFCPKICDVIDFDKLTGLRKLTISHQHSAKKLEIIPQLAKFTMRHLRSSSFRFSSASFTEGELSTMSPYSHPCKLVLYGKIEKLPENKNLPQQLRKLVLLGSQLKEDPMPILERLPQLVILLLGSRAFVRKEMVCSADGFPQLKHLLLFSMPNLEELKVAEGAMPHLSLLGISRCPNLKTLPQGVFTSDGSEAIQHENEKNDLLVEEHWWFLTVKQRRESYFRAKEKKRTKSKGRILNFVLGRTLCGRTREEEHETSDEEELANNEVSMLEASEEESSIFVGEEHETSDEEELCNDGVSSLEASEESSTNLA